MTNHRRLVILWYTADTSIKEYYYYTTTPHFIMKLFTSLAALVVANDVMATTNVRRLIGYLYALQLMQLIICSHLMFISAHLICYCRHSHNNNSSLEVQNYIHKMHIKDQVIQIGKEKDNYKIQRQCMRKLHYHGKLMRKRSRPT